MPPRSVPILTYHQISERIPPSYRKYALTPGEFRRQIAWLASAGYVSVPLASLADGSWDRLPPRPVVITVDDGFQSAVAHAAQILGDHGFTATFYAVAGEVGGQSSWTRRRRGGSWPLADAAALRALERAGHACGSHTLTHPALGHVTPAEVERELRESRHRLEDILGHEVRHLAYPFGSFNLVVQRLAADAGYETACTIGPGHATRDADRLALPRLVVKGDQSFLDFVVQVRTGHRMLEVRPSVALRHAAASLLAAFLPF